MELLEYINKEMNKYTMKELYEGNYGIYMKTKEEFSTAMKELSIGKEVYIGKSIRYLEHSCNFDIFNIALSVHKIPKGRTFIMNGIDICSYNYKVLYWHIEKNKVPKTKRTLLRYNDIIIDWSK